VSDLLDRVFGPDPDSPGFPPFNEAKIIPAHDCDWVEQWSYAVLYVSCSVCHSTPPEPLTRGAVT
jgi:hypothetical protein